MDLYQGYHQIPIKLGNEYKTAFLYCYGTFEYHIMPLKLINAPATFERHMNSYIHDILDKFMIVYLDERLIYSGNKAENEVHLF